MVLGCKIETVSYNSPPMDSGTCGVFSMPDEISLMCFSYAEDSKKCWK